jgi:hypothetical protein
MLMPLIFLICLGIGAEFAQAQCSGEDISSYVQSGATAEQLSQLCGQQTDGGYSSGYSNQYPYPTVPANASVCATQWGPCPPAALLPVGSPCACYTQVGQAPGVAR